MAKVLGVFIIFMFIVMILVAIYGVIGSIIGSLSEFLFNTQWGLIAIIFLTLSAMFFYASSKTYSEAREKGRVIDTIKPLLKNIDNLFNNSKPIEMSQSNESISKVDPDTNVIDLSFEVVLNWLNIPFHRKEKELRGEGFIVSTEKNLFFCPENDELKGSVINFVAHYKKVDLREAAILLKAEFLSKKSETMPKRDIPNLTLEWHPYIQERGISEEIFKDYELGYVKQRSVVAGRIAFKIYDHQGKHIGYIGYKEEDGSWFFPKGFKRPLYNAHRVIDKKSVIATVDPFDALKIASLGFKQVVSLLANSMTTEQEEQLKRFKYILLFHPKPENIINRLFKHSFIKSPQLSIPIKEMSNKDILFLIKPS